MNEFDTDMTSDILIYNILKKSDDEFIQKCNLKFIDKSVPAQEDDTIYIANVDLENRLESYDGTEYLALVNIYVKTKDTDYLEGSRFLRTVVKHIKHVLRNDDACKCTDYEHHQSAHDKAFSLLFAGISLSRCV